MSTKIITVKVKNIEEFGTRSNSSRMQSV
jgi:hypothetical protein